MRLTLITVLEISLAPCIFCWAYWPSVGTGAIISSIEHGSESVVGVRDDTTENAKAHRISNYFHMILNGISEYDMIEESFPAACNVDSRGDLLSSWRYSIVPYTGKHKMPYFADQHWTSMDNRIWARFRSWLYCYNDIDDRKAFETGIVAVAGKGTAFEEGTKRRLKDLDSDTILIVECRNSGLHWMEPGDLKIEELPARIGPSQSRGIWGNSTVGVLVGFADQQVWLLSNDTPMDVLKLFFTVEGAWKHDRQLLSKYRL